MKPLSGKKVLFLVNQVDFRDEEMLQPKEELTAAGAVVFIAARDKATAKGMLGAVVEPDLAIRDAMAADYDAVVAVGGRGTPDWLWQDDAAHALLRDSKAAGKLVAGICLSGATLAIAGVLKGVEATCWPTDDSLKAMRSGGASYVDRPVVVSGKIITANGPPAAHEFGKALIAALSR
ncbi:MAG TPA: DJ-1/PfpI family protein [Candidatus Deferrimicrobiaceae bacterium]|jgi:protease I